MSDALKNTESSPSVLKRLVFSFANKTFLIFFLVFCNGYGFSTTIDSLITVSKTQKDTAKINTLVKTAVEYLNIGKLDDAESFLKQATEENKLAKSRSAELFITLKTMLLHYKKSEFRLAYDLGKETLPLALRVNDNNKLAECKMYMGMCTGRLGDFKAALNFYHEALPLLETTKNISLQMKLYSNIAGVYFDQLDYKMAIEFFQKTLAMAIKNHDYKVIGQTYNNIGSALSNLKKEKEAKLSYLKAVEYNLLSGNKHNLGYNYMNLASSELADDNTVQAKKYNAEALAIFTEFKDPYSIVSCMCVDGDILIKERKYDEAVKLFERIVVMGEKTGSPLLMERTYKQMSNAYELAGNMKQSLIYLKKYIETKDSIINNEIREEVTKKQLYYEFDKKRLADSLEAQSKQNYLTQEVENNKRSASLQRNISIISLVSLCIVAILAFYIYRGLKKNKFASNIIEAQKRIVEVKNKEILDSINYAKRIQGAILPSDRVVKNYFNDSFILYKPKDIVAGDFYWLESPEKLNSNSSTPVIFAAADCTGHGVPGAMVSVVCHNALNRAVREYHLLEPGKILDKTRELVIAEFGKNELEVTDGMDISLCLLDLNTKQLQWSGANNPLWIIRNKELIEYKPNKQPIGKFELSKPFTTHVIDLKANDCLYIFTDGYQDQFGGENSKKFKASGFKELLKSVSENSMEEQHHLIDAAFNAWKGNLEQVDDVCVIGIRL